MSKNKSKSNNKELKIGEVAREEAMKNKSKDNVAIVLLSDGRIYYESKVRAALLIDSGKAIRHK